MIKSNIKKEFNCEIDRLWNMVTDNTSNCDTGSVAKGPVKKLTRN